MEVGAYSQQCLITDNSAQPPSRSGSGRPECGVCHGGCHAGASPERFRSARCGITPRQNQLMSARPPRRVWATWAGSAGRPAPRPRARAATAPPGRPPSCCGGCPPRQGPWPGCRGGRSARPGRSPPCPWS